jgi:cell division protein FtsW
MKHNRLFPLDPLLSIAFTLLLFIGLLILASASMPMAEKSYGSPFYFFYNQLTCLLLGLVLMLVILFTPTMRWQQLSTSILYIVMFLLLLTLFFGVEVNGAKRWIALPGFRFQASELLKIAMVVYMANFIENHYKAIASELKTLMMPTVLLVIASCLLLSEPDFGATVVVIITFSGMIFLAGISLRPLILLMGIIVITLAALAYFSPYRLARLTTFLHPWEYAYGSGYQLTQALISYGRGSWFGLGLGGSIQKQLFLPEAHTDFIFAILAEELGLFGAVFIILLYLLVIARIFYYGICAQKNDLIWQAFICYGCAMYFMAQSFISIGVNLGLLPTKGLTLPFLSYGRSSLLTNCMFVGLVLRSIIEIKERVKKS